MVRRADADVLRRAAENLPSGRLTRSLRVHRVVARRATAVLATHRLTTHGLGLRAGSELVGRVRTGQRRVLLLHQALPGRALQHATRAAAAGCTASLASQLRLDGRLALRRGDDRPESAEFALQVAQDPSLGIFPRPVPLNGVGDLVGRATKSSRRSRGDGADDESRGDAADQREDRNPRGKSPRRKITAATPRGSRSPSRPNASPTRSRLGCRLVPRR